MGGGVNYDCLRFYNSSLTVICRLVVSGLDVRGNIYSPQISQMTRIFHVTLTITITLTIISVDICEICGRY